MLGSFPPDFEVAVSEDADILTPVTANCNGFLSTWDESNRLELGLAKSIIFHGDGIVESAVEFSIGRGHRLL